MKVKTWWRKVGLFLRWPLILIYDRLVSFKNYLYDQGWRKVEQLERPVISVGNLAMGGTGKSPVTAELLTILSAMNFKVAVLSRGYGRITPNTVRVVDREGDWRLYGDEPVMIARRHPNAVVAVGPSRKAAASILSPLPDVYLIDDGFQHRQLHRDLDIVLLDVSQPMPIAGSSHLFRERFAALKRAHLVLLTRWDGVIDLQPWRRQVAAIRKDLPVQVLSFKPATILRPNGEALLSAEQLKGKKVGAWSGIAAPQKFFKLLEELGAEVVIRLALKDHQPIQSQQLRQLVQTCKDQDVGILLTTEKDAVKLDAQKDYGIILGFLAIEVSWTEKDKIERLLQHLLQREKGR